MTPNKAIWFSIASSVKLSQLTSNGMVDQLLHLHYTHAMKGSIQIWCPAQYPNTQTLDCSHTVIVHKMTAYEVNMKSLNRVNSYNPFPIC